VTIGGTVNGAWQNVVNPMSTDWMGLYTTAASDSAYIAWSYTDGNANGNVDLSLPMTLAPGTYELRLFARGSLQRLAVSNPLNVPAAIVTAGPATVAAGGTLTVGWAGIAMPSPLDWFAVSAAGAPDASYTTWGYTGGKSNDSTVAMLSSTLPAGTYEVRLFKNASLQRLAVSGTFTVTASGATLGASPSDAVAGGTMMVNWSGIPAPTSADWIGLYTPGAADSGYQARWTTNGRASDAMLVTVPGATIAGGYELRLFSNNTFTRLAISNPVSVAAGTALQASPGGIAPGDPVSVAWSGVAAPSATDWVAIVPLNGQDSDYVGWGYTTGAASGSTAVTVPLTAPVGLYEAHLFKANTLNRLAVSNVIRVGVTVAASPVSVAAGGTMTVSWTGVAWPTSTDWVALAPLNSPDTTYSSWTYGTGTPNGSLLLGVPGNLPAGAYEVRMFAQNTINRLGISNIVNITAGGGTTLIATPTSTGPGGTLTVSYAGVPTPTPTDWVGLYSVGALDANYISRWYTTGQASATQSWLLPGTLTSGTYELRLFANDTFARRATSNGFTVGSVPIVRANPISVAAGGSITVAWEDIAAPTSTDWVALVQVNGPDTSFIAWAYTGGTDSGSVPLSLPANAPAGTYEVRLFKQNSLNRLGVSNTVTVTP
jgi:ABC-type molybdate transport system substrate-binding protein